MAYETLKPSRKVQDSEIISYAVAIGEPITSHIPYSLPVFTGYVIDLTRLYIVDGYNEQADYDKMALIAIMDKPEKSHWYDNLPVVTKYHLIFSVYVAIITGILYYGLL